MKTGRISDIIYKRSITNRLQRQRAEYAPGEKNEDVVMFSGCYCGHFHDAGTRAVIYAANKAYAKGVRPRGFSLNIAVPERMSEKKVSDFIAQADSECAGLYGAFLGDVGVYVDDDLGDPGNVVANAVCVAESFTGDAVLSKAEPGFDIVLTGCIALDAASDIAYRKRDELMTRLPADLLDRVTGQVQDLSVKNTAEAVFEFTARDKIFPVMIAAAEGGILSALWDFGEETGLGLNANGRSIQMMQEIVEICEFFDIDPYRMDSAGCLLTAVKDGELLCDYLLEHNIEAGVIGKLTDNNDRVILMDEEYRYLEPYRGGRVTV